MKKNEAMYIINARKTLEQFVPFLTSKTDKRSIVKSVEKYNAQFPSNKCVVKSGASRSCVLFDDFVVKFDTGDPWYGTTTSEYRGYREAVEHGAGHYFAPLVKIKVRNHYYYVMEKIETLAMQTYEYSGEHWEADEYCEESVWVYDNFEDFHDENYGFTSDGRKLIIDYACNRFMNRKGCLW